MKITKTIFLTFLLSLSLSACGLSNDQTPALTCKDYNPDQCPGTCTVCPPCLECSSIACQADDVCAKMGFGKDWYANTQKKATNFDECVDAGNPVMESYPRQCRVNNQTFTENIGNTLEKANLIQLDSPRPNEVIKSPLVLTGQARGTWFFEASFPVNVTDIDGKVIGQGIAQAKSDWMTTEFVPFEAKITFTEQSAFDHNSQGFLILKKDNPSGLPENDDALKIPIKFY